MIPERHRVDSATRRKGFYRSHERIDLRGVAPLDRITEQLDHVRLNPGVLLLSEAFNLGLSDLRGDGHRVRDAEDGPHQFLEVLPDGSLGHRGPFAYGGQRGQGLLVVGPRLPYGRDGEPDRDNSQRDRRGIRPERHHVEVTHAAPLPHRHLRDYAVASMAPA